ncbi:MAG: RHS repeat protein [Nitrospirae bacterium]|nr:RHS repeat protein [Nitrospirota bacterium]
MGANNPLSATGYMKGKPYQVKVTNQQGLKYSDITTRYAQDTTSPYFNPPFLVDAETCEGGASCKHAQMAYGNLDTGATYYDANGNLTREDHYGDVDDPNDNKTVARSFITNSDLWIMGLPATETIYSGIGTTTRLAETRFYYDGAPDLSTQPTEGHLTRLERWLNTPDSYLATTMTYDGYGNLLSTTDPRGATSAICYDAGAIFPQKATNALGHIARTDYYGVSWNPACGTAPTPYTGSGLWGQVKSVTDANGQRSTTTYDTFGRPSQTTSPEGLITTTTYLNLGNPQLQRTRTVTVDGSADGLWSERYFDGMGRTYKSLAKGPNGTPVRQDTTYNTRGLVEKQSAPYFDPGETRRDATMTYDAMGRLIQTTAYDGMTMTPMATCGISKTAWGRRRPSRTMP